MLSRADVGRAHVQFSRIRTGLRDEVLQRLVRRIGSGEEDEAERADVGDRLKIPHRIVRQRLEERDAHGLLVVEQQHRVTVGLGFRDHLGGDDTARARTVVGDHLLAEQLTHLLRHDARGQIAHAAGRERHDDAHRPRGVLVGGQSAERERHAYHGG